MYGLYKIHPVTMGSSRVSIDLLDLVPRRQH